MNKQLKKLHFLMILSCLTFFVLFTGEKGKAFALCETLPIATTITPSSDTDKKEIAPSIIGIDDILYQSETTETPTDKESPLSLTPETLANMNDFSFLKQHFYIVDSRTDLLPTDIAVNDFLKKDFSIKIEKNEPKVLIFHTHSTEGYADSDMSLGMQEGIWGVGEELKNILETQYQIPTLHDTGRYDMVDGKGKILGAYERMEQPIADILKKNPSIEVVIDMHRDGLPENIHLTTEVNGKTCSKIMFFNGLCRLKKGDDLQNIPNLTNPNLRDNLAFSLQMQTQSNEHYPDFTRKIYVNAYRYSLHMKPRSLLVEVGSQTNTKAESKNAMVPLAETLATVLKQTNQ